jgi:vacuolar-type H+-ATPase subunit B/Vma2
MSFTMQDFLRDYFKEHVAKLTPEERRQLVESLPPEERLAGLPPEERLAGLSPEQIQQYLKKLTAGRSARPRKPRRKK